MIIPYRLIAAGVAVVVLIGLGWKANDWRNDAARLRLELRAAENRLEIHRAAIKAARDASRDYQDEIEKLRNRPVPRSPVRLCVNPAVPASGNAGSPESPADGILPEQAGGNTEAGPDIGPELRALAREADEVSAALRALQAIKPEGEQPPP